MAGNIWHLEQDQFCLNQRLPPRFLPGRQPRIAPDPAPQGGRDYAHPRCRARSSPQGDGSIGRRLALNNRSGRYHAWLVAPKYLRRIVGKTELRTCQATTIRPQPGTHLDNATCQRLKAALAHLVLEPCDRKDTDAATEVVAALGEIGGVRSEFVREDAPDV